MNKEKDVNLESLYTYSRNNKIRAVEGWIQRYIGEILLNIDDQHLSEAETLDSKAIEADQRNRMMILWDRITPFMRTCSNEKGID